MTPRIRIVAGAAAVAALLIGVSVASLWPIHQIASPTPTVPPEEIWGHVGWQRAPDDPGIAHDSGLDQWMGGVVVGGPGVVARGLDSKRFEGGIGGSMAIWVSEDALSWREVTYEPGESFSHRFQVRGMASGPPGIIASGGLCCLESGEFIPTRWFSSDGEHWRHAVSDGLGPDPEKPRSVIGGPQGFVEVGAAQDRPAVWFSPNGTNWSGISLAVARRRAYRCGLYRCGRGARRGHMQNTCASKSGQRSTPSGPTT